MVAHRWCGEAEKPDGPLVFGSEAGEPVTSFRRAWVAAVLRANGVKPTWSKGVVKAEGKRKGGWKELAPQCHEAFRRINLHWHDLRHEYASRFVERGVPLAQVRDLLGHSSITTTERYDNQTLEALQAAAGRLEGGKVFDSTTPADAGTNSQDSFKNGTRPPKSEALEPDDMSGVNATAERELGDWLAVTDGFRTWVIANAA